MDIVLFKLLIDIAIRNKNTHERTEAILQLLNHPDFVLVYHNTSRNTKIIAQSLTRIRQHEIATAHVLADVGLDIIFAPSGFFDKDKPKFDVFLVKKKKLLTADFKAIFQPTANAVANALISGGRQAPVVVIHLQTKISRRILIDGLKSGINKSSNITNVMLILRHKVVNIHRQEILGGGIYEILK